VRKGQNVKRLFFLWILLYPIPAAFTTPYHALRSILGIPLFVLISAQGVAATMDYFSAWKTRRIWRIAVTGSVYSFSVLLFCKFYFLDYPIYSAPSWHYGMREAVRFAERSSYSKIVLSYTHYPAIYYLFYSAFPPEEYHELPREVRAEFCEYQPQPLNRFYFGRIGRFSFSESGILVIAMPREIPAIEERYTWREVHRVIDPQGYLALWLIEITGVKKAQTAP